MAVFSGNGSATSPSFTFSSDTNLGIYREDADKLGFATAGTGQMFIDSSGNVGIGTSGPASKLDVNGSIETNAALNSFLTTDRRNLILQRLDGIVQGQTNGMLFQQEYTTGGNNPRRIGFFGIKRATSTSGDQRASFTMELCPDNSTNVGSLSPGANTEAFEFRYNGSLNIVKSGGGIEFQGGGAANRLDDYEEGTWNVTFYVNNTTSRATGSGTYRVIGKVVYAQATLTASATFTMGTGLTHGFTVPIGGATGVIRNDFVYGPVTSSVFTSGPTHSVFMGTAAAAGARVGARVPASRTVNNGDTMLIQFWYTLS